MSTVLEQALTKNNLSPPVGMEELQARLAIFRKLATGKLSQKERQAFESGAGQAGGAILPETPPSIMKAVEAAAGANIPPLEMRRVPGDYLGNIARWFVNASASPYLPDLVKITFLFMFFLSYLEKTPIIGSVMSVAMDLSLAGGRVLAKSLQKMIPPLVGLIPLPYTQFAGVGLVSVIGMFIWTTLAMISFGRQDFTSAIDSMLRIIPVPIGDALADAFLDTNRTVYQFTDKAGKFQSDVWNGLQSVESLVQGVIPSAMERVQTGTDMLKQALPEVPTAQPVQVPTARPARAEFEPTPVQGGKSLSRKKQTTRKWRTRRHTRFATSFVRGSRSTMRSARSRRR